ncbi:unnamed protein product [Trypanosoma congolense IL3000]|uniref:WGS project CAEQ00000000 data, annotated contig 1911 n=1 Tax=Trypanosoma congolense (strain IL3000) TaxID=1068625 RepID=F9W9Z0_TRYCI|nr:unnamed protein product [Trypanosoma congolense IL3000]
MPRPGRAERVHLGMCTIGTVQQVSNSGKRLVAFLSRAIRVSGILKNGPPQSGSDKLPFPSSLIIWIFCFLVFLLTHSSTRNVAPCGMADGGTCHLVARIRGAKRTPVAMLKGSMKKSGVCVVFCVAFGMSGGLDNVVSKSPKVRNAVHKEN